MNKPNNFSLASKPGGFQPYAKGKTSPNQNSKGKTTNPSKTKTTVGPYSKHVLAS